MFIFTLEQQCFEGLVNAPGVASFQSSNGYSFHNWAPSIFNSSCAVFI